MAKKRVEIVQVDEETQEITYTKYTGEEYTIQAKREDGDRFNPNYRCPVDDTPLMTNCYTKVTLCYNCNERYNTGDDLEWQAKNRLKSRKEELERAKKKVGWLEKLTEFYEKNLPK